jgi:PAS domain S-box-containing protein
MQRLASIMDAAPGPVFVLNEDASYIYENEPGRIFLGYEPAEIAGKSITDLIVYDPRLLLAGFEDLKEKGYFSGAVRYRHRDGSPRDADVNTFGHTLDDGTRVFVALAHPVPAVRWRMPEVRPASSTYGLTGEETRLLQLIADGFSDPQISQILRVTNDAIGEQVQAILKKMNVPSRTHAAVRAFKERVLL